MDEEKLTFKDLLRKYHIVLGAVAAQAGVEIRIAYFKKGEHITYRAGGQTRTGTIVWVATATRIAGRDIPVQYIVECDQHSGLPDSVWQSDIVMDPREYQAEEEPAMVRCPYCGGMHYAHLVQQCPNNPHRD